MSIVVALVAAVSLSLVGVGNANATPTKGAADAVTTPVTGTFTDANGGTGTFSGQAVVTEFVNQNGSLAAVGTVTGTATDSTGAVVGNVNEQVTWPAQVLQASCDILNLVLGPLHLDVLGLVIDLNQVVLDITAEQGPGNLLGNLLCAIAGLLDPGEVGQLAALLNQVLALLG